MAGERRRRRATPSRPIEPVIMVEAAGEPPDENIEQELEADLEQLGALAGVLSPQQRQILAALNRIERSLHGPTTMLAIAGNFSRLAPPVQRAPIQRLDDPLEFPNL